jgi:hypothetical protein
MKENMIKKYDRTGKECQEGEKSGRAENARKDEDLESMRFKETLEVGGGGGGEKAFVINFKGERKKRVWEIHRKLFKEETDN